MRLLSAKKKPKAKARRASPRWRRLGRQLAWGSLGLSLLGLAGGLVYLWQIAWFSSQTERLAEATLLWTADLGLKVEDVLVKGRQRTQPEEILQVLQIDRGLPMLAFDPHDAKSRLEQLPWVEQAEVERRLPGLIFVRLTERRPMALWQHDRRKQVIDHAGAVIPGAKAEAFADLPLVVGPGAPGHTAALLKFLQYEPDLERQVAAATRIGERRWNLHLIDGIEIKLPEEGAPEAWQLLADMVREHGLLARDITHIDLRMPDRLIVRGRPQAAPETDT